MSDSDAGATMAAPMPCRERAAIIHSPDGEEPMSSDANENTTSPNTNTRLRPKRSPARAPRRSRPPNTSV